MAVPVSMSTLALASAVVLTLGFLLYRAALPKPIPGIPYNAESANRLLGDAHAWIPELQKHGEMFHLLPGEFQKHNTPIMQLFLRPFGRPWVFVYDPQETHDILTRRTREFDRAKFFGEFFQPLAPDWHIHMPTGPRWKAHRRLIADLVSNEFLNEVAGPTFWLTTQDLVQQWKEKARLAKGRPFSASHDIYCAALEIVWTATFGGETGSIKAQVNLLSTLRDIDLPTSMDDSVDFPEAENPPAFNSILTLADSLGLSVQSIFPKLYYQYALHFWPSLVSSKKHKNKLVHERLQAAKAKFSRESDGTSGDERLTCALDLVVKRELQMAEKEGREAVYDSKTIKDELFGVLLAAHETTSTTLCWGLKFLSTHQSVQDTLRAALRSAFHEAFANHEAPSIEMITSTEVPYLEAFMAETHRKGKTAPGTVRTALTDAVVLGCVIPKGTDIFLMNNGPGVQTAALPVDDSKRSKSSLESKGRSFSWDPDTIEQFLPERWLRKDEHGNDEFDGHAGPYFPFGGGPRGCFGRKWGQLELRVILTLVLWNFHLEPTPPALSSFRGLDGGTYKPRHCFVRLSEIETAAS